MDFHVKIGGTDAATENAKAKITVDKVDSTFDLIVGGERVDQGTGSGKNFGLFSTAAGKTYPGMKFKGTVTTPAQWPTGEWNFVQLIKGKRTYEYPSGAVNHNGDGVSWKLDKTYPYGPNYPADGSLSFGDYSGDSPSDPLFGSIYQAQPNPSMPQTSRSKITVDETFNTYFMFKPPGTYSRYVPLRKATWMWGGSVAASDNWSSVTGRKFSGSDHQGAECVDHPQWTQNRGDDHEAAGP